MKTVGGVQGEIMKKLYGVFGQPDRIGGIIQLKTVVLKAETVRAMLQGVETWTDKAAAAEIRPGLLDILNGYKALITAAEQKAV